MPVPDLTPRSLLCGHQVEILRLISPLTSLLCDLQVEILWLMNEQSTLWEQQLPADTQAKLLLERGSNELQRSKNSYFVLPAVRDPGNAPAPQR